ncbi:MAG: ABC transporter substrate-binding protein, partial [Methanothrix sp.]|nr:ABC transporter substrate-binding protein [Methanothrix sp.]
FLRAVASMGVFFMAALLGACGSPPHDVLRFGLASAPVTLDPRFATDATSARIDRLLYRQLVDFDDAFQPVPSLASWQQLAPDHYRFVLGKEGRRFHDGSRLTANDVKATYDFILDATHASPHRATLEMIREIAVVDDDTVDFYLRESDPLFPGRLVIGILPAAQIAAGRAFNTHPLGSGPFEMVAWPAPGQLQLRRIKDGQILEFLQVRDPTVRILKLQRGELDMVQNDLPPELIRYAAALPDLRVLQGKGSNFTYLGFNMQDPVVGRLAVRQAIAYALDREAVIRYVLGGAARPASALLPPDHWAGNPAIPQYPYDPARARALLKAAGFAKGELHIVYKTSNDPFRIRLATIIQQQLGDAGIDVELRSYDWGTFYGDIKTGRFQMFSLSWVGIKMPDIFHYAFYSSAVPPAGANRGHFSSALADHLIDAAQTVTDPAQQADYYRQLQRYLWDELPYVPLWYEDHVFVARRGIEGYTMARDGNYDGLVNVRQAAGR